MPETTPEPPFTALTGEETRLAYLIANDGGARDFTEAAQWIADVVTAREAAARGECPSDEWGNTWQSRARRLSAALQRAKALADHPPGDCEGAPCIWPEDLLDALARHPAEGAVTSAEPKPIAP